MSDNKTESTFDTEMKDPKFRKIFQEGYNDFLLPKSEPSTTSTPDTIMKLNLEVTLEDSIKPDEVIELYKANGWSSAEIPDKLIPALNNSDSLVTARISGKLVGIGNAISDGHLVVYYPHLLVDPKHQGKGIGHKMVQKLQQKYSSFHQQMLIADGDTIDFYKNLGFKRAGKTEPMWIYAGGEH